MYNYPMSASYKFNVLSMLGKMSKYQICSRFHIHISTLNRWIRIYDGNKSSLENKSHRPHTPHPNSHTKEEIKNIKLVIKNNPHIGLNELYGVLKREYAYTRHPTSLFRFLKKNNIYNEVKKKNRVVNKYDTPLNIGVKWQLDVKYVPMECKSNLCIKDSRFYQYTVIDEASRERFIYAYTSQSAASSVDFITRAIIYFGYKPRIIQTDNGLEFTYLKKSIKLHPFTKFCHQNKIIHKLIKPGTPKHNGKVERSHRNDSKRFYCYLKFDSLYDLQEQMKEYLKRSNNIPSRVLGWMSPIEYKDYLTNNS